MGKKKTVVIQNDKPVQNGLGDAVGFQQAGIGFPLNQGAFGTETISNTTTLFKNLRWYLVSNFRQLLCQLYVEIGLIRTITQTPVDDAFAKGFKISSQQLDEDQIKALYLSLTRDGDIKQAKHSGYWQRLFGGSGLIIMTDQDPASPLDLNAIGPDSPLEFRACDMWELFWDKQETEGFNPVLDSEEEDFYDYYGIQLHKSRVMPLKGAEAPSFIRPRLRGWGMSEAEQLVRSVNQYLKASDLTFEVLDEFKLDVYKIKNLVNTLLSPNGAQKVRERVQLANWQKNYQNAVVMDSEDEFDHKQLSFSGLAEAQAGIRMQVAADLRMPVIKLFGQGMSTGMGNSAQEEMENYNAMVEGSVREPIKPHLLRMCEIKCQKLFGMIPDDLEIEFPPLRVLSATDEETVKTQKFTRLLQAKAAGEITTLEFREACNRENLLEIQLDNAGDVLNPDDPQIEKVVAGEGTDETESLNEEVDRAEDGDDEGPNRPDSQKSKAPGSPKKAAVKNSPEFDRASYAADGGDDWIDSRRQEFFTDPTNVDQGLWSRAKQASQAAFGRVKWQFVTWFYEKQGGKFN